MTDACQQYLPLTRFGFDQLLVDAVIDRFDFL